MALQSRFWSLSALVALLGCGEATAPELTAEPELAPVAEAPLEVFGAVEPGEPEAAEPDVTVPEVVEPDVTAEAVEPTVAEAPPTGAGTVAARAELMGRWVPGQAGRLHCIDLSDDGRFELTRRGSDSGGEVVVRGTFTIEGRDLSLRPSSIHAERWVSRCREHVTSAGPLAEFEVLGRTLRVGRPTRFTVTRNGARLRFCGSACEVLRRRTAE